MLDYLDWQSPISLEQVFAGSDGFSHPTMVPNVGTLYLTPLKAEKSRSALMLIPFTASERESPKAKCIIPTPFSLQTKVNEYGGKPYWVDGTTVFFTNSADQCLYSLDLTTLEVAPNRLTQKTDEQQRVMFTDVHFINDDILIAICERRASPENSMSIVSIDIAKQGELTTLIEGADFYNNLVIDSERSQMAWVQWQHPNMPWDENELWLASLDDLLNSKQNAVVERIEFSNEINGQACHKASVCQLLFANNGDLFFSADFEVNLDSELDCNSANFWNVYTFDKSSKIISTVTQGDAEYGYPHWVYGDHRIVQLDDERLICVASKPEGDSLSVIQLDTLKVKTFANEPSTLQHISSDGQGKLTCVNLPHTDSVSLVEFDFSNQNELVSKTLIHSNLELADISAAQAISYATQDGSQSNGFFYAPQNTEFQVKTSSSAKPPLLVMVHGGPTARAYGHFDLQKQFWTSRGFAILDVNHRGSSGYGRVFRDALYGEWGEVDARDIIDGIEHLVQQGKVDANRVCIRGKSAGGYAVLRALTEYPDTFKAGACYYGIGNLVTLAETTHKFEKHYADRLIDEKFDADKASTKESRFYQRSPINKMSQVGSAMIIFQGSLDKVVPPSVAEEIVDALKAADLNYEYVEYADEAHGFRQVSNNIDAWTKELAFYQQELQS